MMFEFSMSITYYSCIINFAQPHRVLIPSDEVKKRTVRQCVSFFAHPDNDVVVKCIDESDKYPAITVKDVTDRRLNATLVKELRKVGVTIAK